MCLMVYIVEVIFGSICMRTLTVSRKWPETQASIPETMPLPKSIKKFIGLVWHFKILPRLIIPKLHSYDLMIAFWKSMLVILFFLGEIFLTNLIISGVHSGIPLMFGCLIVDDVRVVVEEFGRGGYFATFGLWLVAVYSLVEIFCSVLGFVPDGPHEFRAFKSCHGLINEIMKLKCYLINITYGWIKK